MQAMMKNDNDYMRRSRATGGVSHPRAPIPCYILFGRLEEEDKNENALSVLNKKIEIKKVS